MVGRPSHGITPRSGVPMWHGGPKRNDPLLIIVHFAPGQKKESLFRALSTKAAFCTALSFRTIFMNAISRRTLNERIILLMVSRLLGARARSRARIYWIFKLARNCVFLLVKICTSHACRMVKLLAIKQVSKSEVLVVYQNGEALKFTGLASGIGR